MKSTLLQTYGEHPFSVIRLQVSGTQKKIGYQLAEFAAASVNGKTAATPISADEKKRRLATMETYAGVLNDRATGVAEFYHNQEIDPYSLNMSQQLGTFACSSLFCSSDNIKLHGRNYDFTLMGLDQLIGGSSTSKLRPFVDPVIVLEITPTDKGFKNVSVVSHDLFALFDGMNEYGLSIALLAVENNGFLEERNYEAVYEILVPRILLERCKTVEEAVILFEKMPKLIEFIPVHYIVADRAGHSAVLEWECSKKQHGVFYSKTENLACTNHFLSSVQDSSHLAHYENSKMRLNTLLKTDTNAIRDAAYMETTMSQVDVEVKDDSGNIIGATLWRSIYDLDRLTARYWFLDRQHDLKKAKSVIFRL